ncbi:MAG: hypothetical protein OSJ43_11100 [Oscillospiraceae bacterium]|nr:hypothetical protein [Oscillospiraceae bacterium]
MDIVFLILLLAGLAMIVTAQVLKHKGMWNLRNDDAPFHYHRGVDSPYQLTSIGVILSCMAIIGEIGITFGLRAGLWSTAAVAVINAAVNAVWLKRIEEDDKDPRTNAAVNILVSAFALFIAVFMLFMT